MTGKFGPLGFRADDRYRNIGEPRIVEMLQFWGWAHEVRSAAAVSGAQAALERWTRDGLPFREQDGLRLFDPVEVTNFMKLAGLEGRDRYWAEHFVSTHRRLAAEFTGSEQRFTVDFRRTFSLRNVAGGAKLRLRAPLPFTGHGLGDLRVEAGPDIKVEPGRLERRMVAEEATEAEVHAKISFTARAQEIAAEAGPAPDEALYLAEREGLITVTDRIRALAQALAGAGTPPLECVRAFWDHIHENLRCGMVHYDQVDATSAGEWVLDSGWFDCRLGSALFAAFCRARKIPARLLAGQLLYPEFPTNHFWAEAWIEGRGWTPFDFMSWDLSQAGRDATWRERFFGRLDFRMTTERLPREFTGALGVSLPPAWSILQRAVPGGGEISLVGADGWPVYRDTLRVTA